MIESHQVEIHGAVRHRHGWRRLYPNQPTMQPSHAKLLGVPGVSQTLGVDMRAKAPDALDQGGAASCTAHAARAGMGTLRALLGRPAHDDSRKMLYWTGREVAGFSTVEDSGCTIDGIVRAAQIAGACSEATDPYTDNIALLAVPPLPTQYEAASDFRLKVAAVCLGPSDARRALAHGHPVLCGISLFESIQGADVAQSGAVPLPGISEETIGGHAICLLYDDLARGEVWARNSWGAMWGATAPDGRRGWLRLSYEYLTRYGDEFRALVSL